jgi:hypothetical protein
LPELGEKKAFNFVLLLLFVPTTGQRGEVEGWRDGLGEA